MVLGSLECGPYTSVQHMNQNAEAQRQDLGRKREYATPMKCILILGLREFTTQHCGI